MLAACPYCYLNLDYFKSFCVNILKVTDCLLQIVEPAPKYVKNAEHLAMEKQLYSEFLAREADGSRQRMGMFYEKYAVFKLSLGGRFRCRIPGSGTSISQLCIFVP